MLTLRQIAAFRAVMITGSMVRAADMMCVTQPAVSRLIKHLEEELELPLFKRGKGGLNPTSEAIALYTEVEQSYIGLDKIARAAQKIRLKPPGQLRIAATPAMCLGFLPGVVGEFVRSRPDTSVALHTHNSPMVVEQVCNRHYDLGLSILPIDSVGLETGPVHHARCVCILPPGDPLAGLDVVTVEDLRDRPFISLASDSTTRLKIDGVFDAANVPRKLMIESRWTASICSFVEMGMGVSIVEPFTAREFVAHGGIARAFQPDIDFAFALVRPAGIEMSPLLSEFVETLDAALVPYLAPQ